MRKAFHNGEGRRNRGGGRQEQDTKKIPFPQIIQGKRDMSC